MQQPTRHRQRHGRGILLALGLSASRAVGQATSPFIDQATGAQLQRFVDTKTNFGFGIALPPDPSSSFIGQLSFPLVDGAGWGGLSLSGDLKGPPLVACWPDGNGGVVSSFREAFSGEENPSEVQGTFSLKPILDATSANNTFLTFTFLCENCIDESQTTDNGKLGWALASRPVQNQNSPAGVLASPDSGFGDFLANLAAARSTEFDTWAALAQPAVGMQVEASPIDEDAVVNDLKARQTRGQRQTGGRGGFDTDTDGNATDFTNGIDSDTDDDRVRPVNAGAQATRRRRRRAVAADGNLAARQTGAQRGDSRTGVTDTDNSGNDTDFNTALDTDFNSGIDTDSDNGRRVPVRVSRRARSLKTRQATGQGRNRVGFNTDTDNCGNGTDLNSSLDTDADNGLRAPRVNCVAVPRARGVAKRQTARQGQGRNGVLTDTDNSGNGTDLNSGIDTDSDVPRVNRITARRAVGGGATIPRGLAKRQAGRQTGARAAAGGVRGGFDTDSGNDTDFSDLD
ncbi:hypothetical protein QBC34DRAFT_93134 [Podospora aff. communis PSN243]|uniref:Cellobiose dehydrogenase-like cytochrome domain-containing protein n=1 Tax=Podospora aff. communis PSN243 TaxID=3040156 RepID=A0AAV9GKW4_9PEZI|nr:hypothetical protein QBC34DRAFT_93134 [Podospora aff. communis PSN243]